MVVATSIVSLIDERSHAYDDVDIEKFSSRYLDNSDNLLSDLLTKIRSYPCLASIFDISKPIPDVAPVI